MSKVDLVKFSKQIEEIFDKDSIQAKYKTDKREDEYFLAGKSFNFKLTLHDKLIGYRLGIPGENGQLGIGEEEDTDLYPIYGSPHEEIAAEIFNDGIQLLKKVLAGKVLYKLDKKTSILAIELDRSKYKVIRGKKAFIGATYRPMKMAAQDISKLDLKVLR